MVGSILSNHQPGPQLVTPLGLKFFHLLLFYFSILVTEELSTESFELQETQACSKAWYGGPFQLSV